MTTIEQRATTRRNVFTAQFRLLGSLARRDLIIYVLAAIAIVLIASSAKQVPIFHGTASVEGGGGGTTVRKELFAEGNFGMAPVRGLIGIMLAYTLTCFMAFFWPMSVWRDEGPRKRAYHWSMPVKRSDHHLIRVAAGGAWMLGFVVAAFALLALGLLMSGRGSAVGSLSVFGWINLITAPVTLYLLSSIAALQSDRPRRTILGFVVLVFAIYAAFGVLEFGPGYDLFYWAIEGEFSYATALTDGVVGDVTGDTAYRGRWLASALFWLGIGAGLVMWAARRRQER